MKKILLSVVLATTLALTSCQFDDSDIWNKFGEMEESIRDHEQRISALEELCKQMNTNIEALQTLVDALEKRDYVTNVSEVRSNGEVIGYTISFAYSDTITIYHGQDGKDGANGKDGYTPQIGVMKDTDNIYYWTLDGEWLLDGKGNKIKAVGTDGADGKDGQDGTNGSDGKDGQDGTNGTDGKDGVTPQLKIENDYWYVSYDNGATWVQLGKATGEDGKDGQDGNDGADGSDGADGEDGDSIFKSVTQDDEYVYFNLTDGTMITLPKHDKENIQFEDLQVKAICCKNWDTNYDGELSYAEAAAVTTIGTKFKGNTNIIAFTELKYFTGITQIPDNAFNGCSSLWKIELSDKIQTIGANSFEKCTGLSRIDFLKNVTSIKEAAFKSCSAVTKIYIPNSVKEIGGEVVNSCSSLQSVHISDLSAWCNISFASGSSNPANGKKLYFNEEEITDLIIPSDVEILKYAAFYGCASIKTATISDCVTEVNAYVFRSCKNLSTITIGKNVSKIGEQAFSLCSNLAEVYCKALVPPAIYYFINTYDSSYNEGIFEDSGTKYRIYVPSEAYDIYKGQTGRNTGCYQKNWSAYTHKIDPYDFE